MPFNYPVQLDLAEKRCLIVGAGKVALRKAQAILSAGAMIIVVAPEVDTGFFSLAQNNVRIVKKQFSPEDLDNISLVYATTNDININRIVKMEANKRNIMVNVANSREISDFIVPASFSKGNICVSVASDGYNPTASKYLKNYLLSCINDELIDAFNVIQKIRLVLKDSIIEQKDRENLLRKIDPEQLILMLKEYPEEEVIRKVLSCLLS